MNIAEFISVAITLFLIIDPVGNISAFHAVLARIDEDERAKIILRELSIALLVFLFFLYIGNSVMEFCGLTESSLNISGGVLLFIISLRMIFPPEGKQSKHEEREEAPLIVPLAIPLIAGPSTIAYILLLSADQNAYYVEWTLALLGAWSGSVIVLLMSAKILKLIGLRGAKALERLMGMILILMATQMFLNGTRSFVSTLQFCHG